MRLPRTSSSRASRARSFLTCVASLPFALVVACGDSSAGGSGGGDGGGSGGGSGGGAGGGFGGDGGTACMLPGPGATACGATTLPELTTEHYVGSLDRPVFAAPLPGTDDMLVVEQAGTIQRVHQDFNAPDLFLTVDVAYDTFEQGLFSIAFHPDYLTNGRFFVAYTSPEDEAGGTKNVVAEYHISEDPFVADAAEVDRLIEVPDPAPNHNGGMLAFGADGYLYASLGDTGNDASCSATPGCALDPNQPFGKILRFDVDNEPGGYVAPCSPYSLPDGRPEVWFTGLRNPWRFSFDRLTGDMYIADVGENAYEEIDFIPAGTGPGLNFGWRGYEGFDVFSATHAALVTDHYEPVVVMAHDGFPNSDTQVVPDAACIVGGYVYRGSAIPGLQGYYLFSDCQSLAIGALRMCDGQAQDLTQVLFNEPSGNTNSFAEDANGELYILGSTMRRIIAAPP